MCNINPFTTNPLTLSTLQSNKPLSCKLSFSSPCHTNIFKWTATLPPFLQPPVGSNLPTGGQLNHRPFTCHVFNCSTCRCQNCTLSHSCELCGANHSAKHCPRKRQSCSINQTLGLPYNHVILNVSQVNILTKLLFRN